MCFILTTFEIKINASEFYYSSLPHQKHQNHVQRTIDSFPNFGTLFFSYSSKPDNLLTYICRYSKNIYVCKTNIHLYQFNPECVGHNLLGENPGQRCQRTLGEQHCRSSEGRQGFSPGKSSKYYTTITFLFTLRNGLSWFSEASEALNKARCTTIQCFRFGLTSSSIAKNDKMRSNRYYIGPTPPFL